MEHITLDVYHYENNYINISLKDIRNPYCVYLPIKNNKIIKKFVYINEISIALFLFNYFKTRIHKYKTTLNIKINSFLNWIYTLKKINHSNWRVLILNLYRNNLLN